jgi:hypothetical protein
MSSHHVQTSYVKGEGYGPFLLVALSFWKSTKNSIFCSFWGPPQLGKAKVHAKNLCIP